MEALYYAHNKLQAAKKRLSDEERPDYRYY